MPIKFSKNIKKLRALTFAERAKPKFFKLVAKFIGNEIVKSILRGVSPVKKGGKDGSSGKLRYKNYSESYQQAIRSGRAINKKLRPVNLKQTGVMLDSIKVEAKRNSTKVEFTDPIAVYHDKKGAGKSKIKRRLVPHKGEQWNSAIAKKIADALKKAISSSK